MMYLQRVFTVATYKRFSPSQSMGFSKLSVSICQQLGIHGRAFSNDIEALFVTEGPEELVKSYYNAVVKDPHTDFAVIHSDEEIQKCEFKDYSVWLSSYDPGKLDYGPSVHLLTSETIKAATPCNLSSKLKIRIRVLAPSLD